MKRARAKAREESCTRKVAHPSWEDAEAHALRVRGSVYRCGFCAKWHVTSAGRVRK